MTNILFDKKFQEQQKKLNNNYLELCYSKLCRESRIFKILFEYTRDIEKRNNLEMFSLTNKPGGLIRDLTITFSLFEDKSIWEKDTLKLEEVQKILKEIGN